MTATELSDACEIPSSTLYRKLDLLTDAALVRELEMINPSGGRTTKYERDFEDVMISIDEDEQFSVTVERPSRNADEQLAHIWSKMSEEL